MELNDFEIAAIVAGAVTTGLVMVIAACLCSYLDRQTEARIWQDKRDLSRIDML